MTHRRICAVATARLVAIPDQCVYKHCNTHDDLGTNVPNRTVEMTVSTRICADPVESMTRTQNASVPEHSFPKWEVIAEFPRAGPRVRG